MVGGDDNRCRQNRRCRLGGCVIVCPQCETGLVDQTARLSCPSCGYSAIREDGVILFNPEIQDEHEDYKAEGLDQLYRHERQHAWFKHRVNLIRKAFAAHVGKGESILEVGAGTGYSAQVLLADGYRSVSIGEIHKNGLLYAKQYGLKNLYQFDLRSSPFREHFEVVALFDVLEHIANDELAIKNIYDMLRPGGRIILTVPAHRWLWSRLDELAGHHRRYSRKSLRFLLASAGFQVLEARYFFTALVPGLLVRSFVSRNTTRTNVEAGCGLNVSPFGNMLLGLAAGPGDTLLTPLRWFTGGSLLAVARKT
jgi:2-polyprenyl-3-methyl-5-hydroxy-6-metoxy-1,4-benzoquinol methylase